MIAPVTETALERVDRFFTPSRTALIILLFSAINFWDVLLGINTFFFRDYGLFGYPLAAYHRERFWAGELPLWNPFNNCGLPFLAQWNTLALYPLSFIYLLLPLPWSLAFFCLIHLFLGAMGMYFLARHWTGSQLGASIAGVTFAFGGLALSSLKWPNNIAGLGLMPWVVLAVTDGWRRGIWIVPVGAVLAACQFLAGAPEIILLTWIFLGFVFVHDLLEQRTMRRLLAKRASVNVLLVTALAAVQLLPFFNLLGLSQRDSHFHDESWSLPLAGLVNFVLPLFSSFPSYHGVFAQQDQYWISSYYPGIAVLALAGFALVYSRDGMKWPLLAAGIFGLVMALGNAGWVQPIVKGVVPIFRLIRFPIKFVVLPCFIIPLLAAYGIQAARATPLESIRRCGMIIGAGFVVVAAVFTMLGLGYAAKFGVGSEFLGNAVARILFLLLCGALGWVLIAPTPMRSSGKAAIALLTLLWLDLIFHTTWQNPTAPSWTYGVPAEIKPKPVLGKSRAFISPANEVRLDHLLPANPTDDVLLGRLALFCNWNLLDRIPKVNGFFSLSLREEARVEDELYGRMEVTAKPLLAFLGVSQVSRPGKTLDWVPQTNHLPLVTGGQHVEFGAEEEVFRKIFDPQWNPERVVYLGMKNKTANIPTNTECRVLSSTFTANHCWMRVEASGPSMVVIAQSFHPGWRAYVGGREVPIWRANYAFQALAVPGGTTEVECVYKEPGLITGAWISLIALSTSVWLLRKNATGRDP